MASDGDCKCGLGNLWCLVYTHRELHQFHNPLLFFVNLVCYEADADVRLNPSGREMEHWLCSQIAFRNSECTFHHPKLMVLGCNLFCRDVGVCDISLSSVPPLILQDFLLIDGDFDIIGYLKELVVTPPVDALFLDCA